MKPIFYSLDEISVLVKRHSHDTRNVLNGMELELTLLEESTTQPATREAVERLREANLELGRLVQSLSAAYAHEPATWLPAIQVAEIWQADALRLGAGSTLTWSLSLGSESVRAETGLLRWLLKEMLTLATRLAGKRSLQIDCRRESDRVIFEITTTPGEANAGIVKAEQSIWMALGRLAERNEITVEPRTLSPESCFPMKVSLPTTTTP